MEQTKMYVEYIVIGFETILWIVIGALVFSGIKLRDLINNYSIDSAVIIAVGLLVCYIIGIITDRFFDWIVDIFKIEDKIKKKYEIKAKRTLFIWHKYDEMDYYNFTMSIKRIMRATIFNSVFGVISLIAYMIKFNSNQMIIYVLLLTCIFGIGAFFIHNRIIDEYYKKAKDFEECVIKDK